MTQELQAEIETLRQQLVAARAELAAARKDALDNERLAELGTLTGGLAHEIKNPLSTVQLNLQLLGEDVDPEWPGASRVLHRLKTVQGETKRLRDTLDDFLRYAGKLELEPIDLDLQSLLEDLADFFEPQAQVARVRLRVRPSPHLTARADARLIKQTVLNLMLNAIQAMPDGGELILSAGASADGRWAELRVTDTGLGIPPEKLSKIFDAYYSTKRGGTGLGLAMSRRIVREHGGELTVQSDPGKGSEFTIRLPMSR